MVKLRRPSYETKIANLRLTHLALPSGSIWPLLDALGCACLDDETGVDVYGVSRNWFPTTPKRTRRVHEALIGETLALALDTCAREAAFIEQGNDDIDFSLLDGLSKHRRYLSCFNTEEGSYHLALLLFNVTERTRRSAADPDQHGNRDNYLFAMDKAGSEAFCRLVNDWLKPAKPFLKTPSTEILMRVLFGDALCDLVGSDVAHSMVRSGMRPPFMPGLLPAHLESAPHPLPGLDTP